MNARVVLPLLLVPLLLARAPSALAQGPGPDAFAPVRAELEQIVSGGSAIGAVGLLDRAGEVVLAEAVGTRDGSAPMQKDSIFRIYSMTKPITCAAALILFDEGRFALDDPIGKYLPELAELEVDGSDEAGVVRVRDLFQHTTGWSYETPWQRSARAAGHADPGLAGMVDALADLPLAFVPGTRWEYGISNDVLGRLIEVLAETTLDRFFAERVFAPLGMVDSGFFVPEGKIQRLAALYLKNEGELVRAPARQFGDPTELPAYLSGGGGLFSTLDDYHRFLRMMRAGGEFGGKRILREETIALMTTDKIGDIPRSAILLGKGFGLGVSISKGKSILDPASDGTWSWGGAAGTSFWVDPKTGDVGIFLVQNWMDFGPATRFQGRAMAALRELDKDD